MDLSSPGVAFVLGTVRNHSREDRMAVPMVSSAKGATFGAFRCRVTSFRVAGLVLRNISIFFKTSKVSLSDGAIYLPYFQKKILFFSGQATSVASAIR